MTSSLLKKSSAKTIAKANAKELEAPGLSGDKKSMEIAHKLFQKYGAEFGVTPAGPVIKCGEDYAFSLKKMAKNAGQDK